MMEKNVKKKKKNVYLSVCIYTYIYMFVCICVYNWITLLIVEQKLTTLKITYNSI